MRARGAFAVLAAVASLAGTPAAGAAPERTLAVSTRVLLLAADGDRVAFAAAATATTCDRIRVWRPQTGALAGFEAGTSCAGGETSAGEYLGALALAGTRLAWLEVYQGNLQDLVLMRRDLGQQRAHQVAFAENHNGAEGSPDGDYLGGLHGDGGLLAYGAWSVCTAVPAGWEWDGPQCDDPAAGDDPVEVIGGEELHRVGKSAAIRTGPTAFRVADVDGDRIVTLQERTVTIVGRLGAVRATVDLAAGADPDAAALSGSRLAVQRADSLELYDAGTGALERTLPLAAGAILTDLEGELAAYLAGASVRVLDVETGVEARFSTPASGPVDAELESAGLSYAYNGRGAKPGRIVFVPSGALAARLRQATAFAQSP